MGCSFHLLTKADWKHCGVNVPPQDWTATECAVEGREASPHSSVEVPSLMSTAALGIPAPAHPLHVGKAAGAGRQVLEPTLSLAITVCEAHPPGAVSKLELCHGQEQPGHLAGTQLSGQGDIGAEKRKSKILNMHFSVLLINMVLMYFPLLPVSFPATLLSPSASLLLLWTRVQESSHCHTHLARFQTQAGNRGKA